MASPGTDCLLPKPARRKVKQSCPYPLPLPPQKKKNQEHKLASLVALAGLPETAKVPYPVVLSSKRGILRGQLIQDDVDGQHQEHQDHAEHQQPLRKCTSWSNLVHLPTRTEHTASTWDKVVNKMNLNSANCAFLSNLICQEKQNITGNIQNTL